jgi:DNA-directed RNA polymerase subunit RPC12/RpoP
VILRTHNYALPTPDRDMYECRETECQGYETFTSLSNYEEHMRVHRYMKVRLRCEECGKDFPSAFGYRRHVLSHEKERRDVMCEHCGETFEGVGFLRVHMRREHKEETQMKKPVEDEDVRVRRRKRFKCPVPNCNRAFTRTSYLGRHTRTAHVEGRSKKVGLFTTHF